MKKTICDICSKEIKDNNDWYHCVFQNIDDYSIRDYDFCCECYHKIKAFIRDRKSKSEQNMV